MSSSALTTADLRILDGEPRILDLRLAERLGYARPGKIRDLIRRNLDELTRYGDLRPESGCVPTIKGILTKDYYLNERQAILATMWSDAPEAADGRQEIVAVFVAWRRGELGHRAPEAAPSIEAPNSDASKLAAVVKWLARLAEGQEAVIARLTAAEEVLEALRTEQSVNFSAFGEGLKEIGAQLRGLTAARRNTTRAAAKRATRTEGAPAAEREAKGTKAPREQSAPAPKKNGPAERRPPARAPHSAAADMNPIEAGVRKHAAGLVSTISSTHAKKGRRTTIALNAAEIEEVREHLAALVQAVSPAQSSVSAISGDGTGT